MEGYVVYLFYLALVLLFGVIITATAHRFKLSSVLFLVLLGYGLQQLGLNYFNHETVLVITTLALILLILESSLKLDIKELLGYKEMFTYSAAYFLITTTVLSLLIFFSFDVFNSFETLILSIILGVIIYGVDPLVAHKFFHHRSSKVKKLLEIEGMISNPTVVIFSLYLLQFLETNSPVNGVFQSIFLPLSGVLLGGGVAFLFYRFIKNFTLSKEFLALVTIALAIIVFSLSSFFNINGGIAVVVFALITQGLTKEQYTVKYASVFSDTLYLIAFILVGTEFLFPELHLWPAIIGLFLVYLFIRFLCITFFLRDLHFKETIFMTCNIAKGIEIALILFLMKLGLGHIKGMDLALEIGFTIFLMSYVVSTIINHFSHVLLHGRK